MAHDHAIQISVQREGGRQQLGTLVHLNRVLRGRWRPLDKGHSQAYEVFSKFESFVPQKIDIILYRSNKAV